MKTRPKQIVIDKSAFVGAKLDALSDFAHNHLLLLSDTLLYTTNLKHRYVFDKVFNRQWR